MAKERKGPKPAKGAVGRIHKPEKKRSEHKGFFAPLIRRNPVRWAVLAYATFVLIVFFGAIFSPSQMVYGTDTMSAGVFFRSFYAEHWRHEFSMPMWNPYIHAGLPFVDAMHGDIFYPAAILQIILPVTYALGLKLFLHIFLAGVFMFLFLRALGRSDTAAFVGGILYMFAPFLVSLIYPGHDGKIYVTALTPLAFHMLYRAMMSRRLLTFFGFGMAYAAMILSAHVQMAYYSAWGLGAYFIFLLWDTCRLNFKRMMPLIAGFALAVLLALGATAIQWMAPYKYANKYSQRLAHQEEEKGFAWSGSWSMNSEELLSMLNPEFPGSNLISDRPATYWGQNFFKLNSEAVGVMTVALAVVAIAAVPTATMWFFAGLSVVALLFAMGPSTPVFRLFYDFVPMVSKFRAPSMMCFLFGFSWVVMAGYGIDALRESTSSETRFGRLIKRDPLRILTIFAAVYLGLTLIAVMVGPSLLTGWASLIGNSLSQQKQAAALAHAASVRNGFLFWSVILWGMVLIFHLKRKGIASALIATVVLAHLAGISLVKFDKRFVQTVDPKRIYGERGILRLIQQNAGDQPYRVLNVRGTGAQGELEDNYLALHGIEELSPSAMHGNHLLTYDIFVGRHDATPALLTNAATLNLLNATLIISRRQLKEPGWVSLGQSEGFQLYRNTDAMPRAAVFYQYEVEPDTNATLARIRSDDFPYRSRLILDQQLPDLAPAPVADVPIPFTAARVVAWSTNSFEIECTAARKGLLWLSENYYPAWVATDETGKTLPVYRADYTFRAVPIKAGTHRIIFEYHSGVFANSAWLSLVCLLILISGSVVSRQRGRTESAPPAEEIAA